MSSSKFVLFLTIAFRRARSTVSSKISPSQSRTMEELARFIALAMNWLSFSSMEKRRI